MPPDVTCGAGIFSSTLDFCHSYVIPPQMSFIHTFSVRIAFLFCHFQILFYLSVVNNLEKKEKESLIS